MAMNMRYGLLTRMSTLIGKHRYSLPFLFLTAIVLNACVSSGILIGADQLTIDRIASERVHIGAVYLRKTSKGISIFGEVKFKRAMISTPPDHIVVTIIDSNGKVLYTARTRYYRYGKPTKESDDFNFSFTIPSAAPKGSIMRLMNETASL